MRLQHYGANNISHLFKSEAGALSLQDEILEVREKTHCTRSHCYRRRDRRHGGTAGDSFAAEPSAWVVSTESFFIPIAKVPQAKSRLIKADGEAL